MKPLPLAEVEDSARCQFLGILFNWGLYGILVAQTCTYIATFPRDMRINKVMVYVVFFLETTQTTLLSYDLYQTFVVHFGDAQVLERMGLKWFSVPLLAGVVGWIAQLFYAWRIYKLSRARKISVIVMLLAFLQLGSAIAESLRARTAATLPGLRVQQDVISVLSGTFWVLAMVSCDIIIAVVMTYYLLKLRREFYYDSSFFVRRLLLLTVETGSVTAFAAIMAGLFFVGKPGSEAFNIPGFTFGKLYAVSLLRVLHSRHRADASAEILTFPVSLESPLSSQQSSSSRVDPRPFGPARTYIASSLRDTRAKKAVVIVVLFLETIQTTLLSYDLYQTFVAHFGEAQIVERMGLKWFTVPLLGGVTGWITQLFYAWWIYIIARAKKTSGVVALLAFSQLITAIAQAIRAHIAATIPGLRVKQDPKSVLSGTSWVLAMVACNLVIAIAMSYYLMKLRRDFLL
ncbi:hypothetical protein NP233_g4389 [Leucocoprinus birnbaumii]|uniref:DUF6534 domain-containing protein n=1 Tax=Leucocoprinus birnbaumii TaxID=56174 RepID=A0AAD5YX96_9AGAR|nr:hypothetical protein NP233_g4389 [Leucocoprinus birnbaumii]